MRNTGPGYGAQHRFCRPGGRGVIPLPPSCFFFKEGVTPHPCGGVGGGYPPSQFPGKCREIPETIREKNREPIRKNWKSSPLFFPGSRGIYPRGFRQECKARKYGQEKSHHDPTDTNRASPQRIYRPPPGGEGVVFDPGPAADAPGSGKRAADDERHGTRLKRVQTYRQKIPFSSTSIGSAGIRGIPLTLPAPIMSPSHPGSI